MGLFQRKQQQQKRPPIDETSDGIQRFFDGYFAELRERGRVQFEKSLNENAAHFKNDLDETIAKADSQLRQHIAKQLDDQAAENNQILKEVQDQTLQSLTQSAQSVRQQHEKLGKELEQDIAKQQELLTHAFEENKAQIAAMKEAQAQALQWLQQSAQAMQQQHQQLTAEMQKRVAAEQEMLVDSFEKNMAVVVEHYLLGALGDQYDLKAQLPSIVKQMEANKQAMVDDMKL